jgi:hypothetical protein
MYEYRYIQEIKRIYAPVDDDALLLGRSFHLGMEKTIEAMRTYYIDSFPITSDKQENELIKMEYWLDRGHQYLRELDVMYKEYMIDTDDFRGIIDL